MNEFQQDKNKLTSIYRVIVGTLSNGNRILKGNILRTT